MEEERERKIQEMQEAKERQKREIQENKIRRVHLVESVEHFGGEISLSFGRIRFQMDFALPGIQKEIDGIYAEMRKLREVSWRLEHCER